MDWFETAAKLSAIVRRGDTQKVIAEISKVLRSLPQSPYHQVLELEFTNSPQEIAAHFDKFLAREKSLRSLGAVYTETNGFDVNTDRWYFDMFAYEKHGGQKNMDWLSDWTSDSFPDLTLTGMESLQETYEEEDIRREDDEGGDYHEDAMYHCSLLVVAKFQDLIRQSVPLMKVLDVPLLATGHGYDFIAEFKPANHQS